MSVATPMTPPGYNPPPGYRWAPVPDPDWRIAPAGRTHYGCRAGAGRYGKACGAPVVAELWRPHAVSRWWGYCLSHTHSHGVWIEGDRVQRWRCVAWRAG